MKYLIATLPFLATIAAAHPGHDHSSWTAPLLHALWIAPIAIAAVFAVRFVFKKISK
ncbi:MAG: hypothetical protein KGV56_04540 [Gammaproteobacteria bacterium]|nr:hypothetical protein [Gammaproteobacteria bacterium]